MDKDKVKKLVLGTLTRNRVTVKVKDNSEDQSKMEMTQDKYL